MLVFLIGYMGSGKSTLGKSLARKLMMEFCDMDALIEKQEQCSTSEIFATKGENYFRECETEYLKNLSSDQNFVVATGGGAPCFNGNMDIMNQKGETVYLDIKPGILTSRLKFGKAKRPLIASKTDEELLEFVEGALEHRNEFYRKAKYIIKGDNIKVDDIINALKE
ncbi:MAG: shikimate kinase [Rikenellaceae bacterium]